MTWPFAWRSGILRVDCDEVLFSIGSPLLARRGDIDRVSTASCRDSDILL